MLFAITPNLLPTHTQHRTHLAAHRELRLGHRLAVDVEQPQALDAEQHLKQPPPLARARALRVAPADRRQQLARRERPLALEVRLGEHRGERGAVEREAARRQKRVDRRARDAPRLGVADEADDGGRGLRGEHELALGGWWTLMRMRAAVGHGWCCCVCAVPCVLHRRSKAAVPRQGKAARVAAAERQARASALD